MIIQQDSNKFYDRKIRDRKKERILNIKKRKKKRNGKTIIGFHLALRSNLILWRQHHRSEEFVLSWTVRMKQPLITVHNSILRRLLSLNKWINKWRHKKAVPIGLHLLQISLPSQVFNAVHIETSDLHLKAISFTCHQSKAPDIIFETAPTAGKLILVQRPPQVPQR